MKKTITHKPKSKRYKVKRYKQKHKMGRKSYALPMKIDIYHKAYLPSHKPREEDPIQVELEKEGFNPAITMVHGTSKENAEQIKKDMSIKTGTLVHPGRGGFEDAKTWAENTTKEPRIVVAESPEFIKKGRQWWMTVGKRAEEREGIDATIPTEVKLTKVAILKPVSNGKLEEE
jgi:hypothetical protein